MKKTLLILTLAVLGGLLVVTYAQDQKRLPLNRDAATQGGAGGQGGPPGRQGGPGGAGGEGGFRPPKHPLETALDANGDGVIDATEIANASAALKKLDKNGDGKLTEDEYRPMRPQGGPGGPGGGRGGPGGPGGPGGQPPGGESGAGQRRPPQEK